MMGHKVLIATRSFGRTSNKPRDVLAQAGCEVFQADMSLKMTEDRLIDLLHGVDAAIIGIVPMTARVLEAAPHLKVVSAHGIGVDHVDLDAAARSGIRVANCPGANAPSVADLTIGLMIALARDLPRVDKAVRRGDWGSYHGAELWKKTLGIVGLGRIGAGVAKRARGFDMIVLACDPQVQNPPPTMPQIQLVRLEEVIAQADFLSLHTPLNDNTRHIIGAVELAAMKPEAYLINTARGGLVEEPALFKALTESQIAGAALDVFEDEPPGNSPLLSLPNLIATPHIGAHTKESIERVGVMAAENVILCLNGGQPHGLVV